MKQRPLSVVEWLVFFGIILFCLTVALFALRAVAADGLPEQWCHVEYGVTGKSDARWLELRRFRVLPSGLRGALDTGFAASMGVESCEHHDVAERGKPVRHFYDCWTALAPADVPWFYDCRACNNAGCSAWKSEVQVSCTNPSGSDCPLFPEATP